MVKFVAGFVLASTLWGAFIFAYRQGWIDISLEPEAPQDAVADEALSDEPDEPGKTGRPKRKRSGVKRTRNGPVGNSTTGDDLRENEARTVNMGASGGEQQLRGTEIEQGFDSVFSQVRRCLVLAASDEPPRGKLIFGLRISGEGKVTAVNLSGPSTVSQGDAGACLRKAASGMHFRSFNGPDMVVHYPLSLE